MALQKCRECGSEISTSAVSCPKCGAQLKEGCLKSGCLGILVLFLLAGLAGMLGKKDDEPSSSVQTAEITACIARGRAYFTEIGSYPFLSDGRSADKVASERCNRTTTAF